VQTDIDLTTVDIQPFPNAPLLTALDVARLLQLSEVAVRRIFTNGQGPKLVRVGGSIRVDPLDLREWVLSGEAAKARTTRGYKSAAK
jgi:predicted DNA-binding transcriptional regulator AlpA